jgi:hypothetical protein
LWQSILDALILLDARLDATAVARFFPRWPVQTLILVNNARVNRDEALLSLLDFAPDGTLWRATANLALRTKPNGFAAFLLREQRWRLTVHVVDRRDGALIGGGGGGGTSDGYNYAVLVPSGYPPIASYQLPLISLPGQNGGISWPDSFGRLFYLRTIVDRLPGCGGLRPGRRQPDEDRLAYVAALLNSTRAELFLRAEPSATVVWTNAESLRIRIAQERKQLADRYRLIVARLAQGGHLSPSEAEALTPPSIDVRISDQRDDRRDPLPAISGEN